MKVKHLTLATAGSLLAVGAAQAAFVGVEIKTMDHWWTTDNPNASVKASYNANPNLDSWRIYAVFDAPDAVVATTGAGPAGGPQEMFLNLSGGSYYNYTETTPTYGNTTVFNVAPPTGFTGPRVALPYDTFATIGQHQGADATAFTPGGPDVASNNFTQNFSSTQFTGGTGGWFVSGFPAQANATQTPNGLFTASSPYGAATDGRYYVLLFQLTADSAGRGVPVVTGQFGVASQNSGNNVGFFTTPTPGALALLGLAGLAGNRRRRSA
jgi:MYXO-CTERM domain-containing protein